MKRRNVFLVSLLLLSLETTKAFVASKPRCHDGVFNPPTIPHHSKGLFRRPFSSTTRTTSLDMVRVQPVKHPDDATHKFQKALLRVGQGILFAKPVGPTVAQALFGLSIKSKRKNEKTTTTEKDANNNIFSFTMKESLMAIAIYLGIGVAAYSFLMEHWSLIDSLYFSIVVFTTVGLGDLVPTRPAAKLFTCVFALGGIAFLAAALAAIGSNIVETELKASRAAKRVVAQPCWQGLKRLVQGKHASLSSAAARAKNDLANTVTAVVPFTPKPIQVDDHQPKPPPKVNVMQVVAQIIPRLGFLMGIGLLFGRIEGWSIVDSIYYGLITAGTVGFGDKAPTLQISRLLACLAIPLAVATGGEILATIATAFLQQRRAHLFESIAQKDFNVHHFKEMDSNGDGKVSKLDYLEFMLVEMQLVDEGVIQQLEAQFDLLDMTKCGTLTKKDLIYMAKLRRRQQQEMEEAVAAAAALENTDDLDDLNDQAAAALKSAHILQEDDTSLPPHASPDPQVR